MKISGPIILALALGVLPAGSGAFRAAEAISPRPGMLAARYPIDALAPRLLPTEAWRPFPPAADRKSWEALLAMRQWRAGDPADPPLQLSGTSRAVLGPLMELFWVPAEAQPAATPALPQVWLPDLQVLVARETVGQGTGLVLAAKSGHNAESHNHNDSGHFVVFLDGQPGIIDIGREEYSAKTFSKDRYDLWFTRGLGHNAPVGRIRVSFPRRGRAVK